MPPTSNEAEALPPIAALFLVVFDQRIGYKIAWKRSVNDVELDGVVEYKSLPSGLHNVKNDLVYFTHDDYAGISAFVSKTGTEAQRNARFAAVGALVPLSFGRLGKAWTHAQALRNLAESEVDDQDPSGALDKYWEEHRLEPSSNGTASQSRDTQDIGSPAGKRGSTSRSRKRRSRALSDATGTTGTFRDDVLPDDHPAMSMPVFLDTFGPLAFPLYRLALLRKRILIVGSAPIQTSCDYVYDVSVFSKLPSSLYDVISAPRSVSTSRPLFNVGVHDIPFLSKTTTDNASEASDLDQGWLACTTDDILATKKQLYDALVELPHGEQAQSGWQRWPTIKLPDGTFIKATQRDLRHYSALRKELRRIERVKEMRNRYQDDEEEEDETNDDGDSAPLLSATPTRSHFEEEATEDTGHIEAESQAVESQTWAAIAYGSFLWWASAGEKDALEAEEASQDAALLDELSGATSNGGPPSRRKSRERRQSNSEESDPLAAQQTAMILVAYFHRLTSLMMETIAEIVNTANDNEENEDSEGETPIVIESEDLRRMGLDIWSLTDRRFVTEMLQLYFERVGEVRGMSVECCGIKIC